MTHPGKVYATYQPDNPEAWYLLSDIDPNDRDSRQILMSDGEHCNTCWSDDDSTWEWGRNTTVYWRELCPLPDVRSKAERERDAYLTLLKDIKRRVENNETIMTCNDIKIILEQAKI